MIEFFSGSNRILSGKRAVKEALNEALGAEYDPDVKLMVIHCGISHDYREIYEAAKECVPNATIIGCTGAGIIGREGPKESQYGFAMMAMKAGDNEIAVAHVDEIDGRNSKEKATKLASYVKAKNGNVNMLYYIGNGIDVANDMVIQGIETLFGHEITIFGCTSADVMKAEVNYQFFNENIYEKGAILVGFADHSLEVITGATHGFVPLPETEMQVTKAEKNKVIELDNQSAIKVLTDKLHLTENASLGQIIPVGALAEPLPEDKQAEYKNSHILRVISRKDEDGSIYSTTTVREGQKLMITERDENKIFSGTDELAKKIAERAGNRKPCAVFHADCGARGKLFGARVLKEEIVNRMQAPVTLGDATVPWLGIYGFGEFAKIGGKNYYHNYTSSLYAIYRK